TPCRETVGTVGLRLFEKTRNAAPTGPSLNFVHCGVTATGMPEFGRDEHIRSKPLTERGWQFSRGSGKGDLMKDRVAVAFLAISFTAGGAFAADVPVAAPQFYGAGRLMSVDWTGLYFGVNAGYGWAQGSSNIGFVGDFSGGTTTPSGRGATELGGTRLIGSGNMSGAIAGGQMGFNWQSGMVVFGAEVDAQWSGQRKTFSAPCEDDCVATETMKIKSIVTGRGRIGLAFDWLMPYVTAGGALVNAQNDLTVTVGGVPGHFPGLSSSTL